MKNIDQIIFTEASTSDDKPMVLATIVFDDATTHQHGFALNYVDTDSQAKTYTYAEAQCRMLSSLPLVLKEMNWWKQS